MQIRTTSLPGVLLVEPELHSDARGAFARTWCAREFAQAGLHHELSQCGVSWNIARGTLRGMHYQVAPHGEVKLVRCTRGAIYDVALDLRPDSATRGQWTGAELTADNRCELYVPPGCAHGFQTLVDHTEVLYLMGHPQVPEAARGVRWDDPAFAIDWPLAPTSMADRDRNYLDWVR